MKAPTPQRSAQRVELDVDDFTQEIDASLEEFTRRDEPTLSKLDFEDIEIALDL